MGSHQGVYDTTAVLERPVGRRLVPALSLVCRAQVMALATQVEANVEVHEHSGSAPLFLLNTGERHPSYVVLQGASGPQWRECLQFDA